MLRKYPLGDLLGSGRPAIGTVIAFNSGDMMEVISTIGFDFVMIDCEHGPMQADTVLEMIRIAEHAGVAPLVRVSSHQHQEALRFLDIGAAGIVFPRVESRQDALAVAAAVRYPPKGMRGLAPTIRSTGYGVGMDLAAYQRMANQQLMVIPIVETAAGVAAVDEILSVEGVDALALGAVDLSMDMGCGGDTTTPEVAQAMQRLMASCRKHRKPALMAASTKPQLLAAMELGATMVMVPFSNWLIQLGRGFLRDLRPG
jgi:2-keto-3-deoxy-L-rhamnonate aldolase RhmA